MRSHARALLSAVVTIAVVAASGACAHRRQIYDSSDFARRPIVRKRPALSRAPAKSRLASEPTLARTVDDLDGPSRAKRDEIHTDSD